MKRITIFILSLFLILSLSNCGKRLSSEANSFLSINIDESETRNVNLSELVVTCDIIPLETKSEALLNRANGFAISKDYILITDLDQNPAKLFTRNGKYIRDIGKIGIGPDEYLTVVSPYIDEKNNSMWLLLGGNYENPKDGWYYIYNKDGKIIQKINTIVKEDDAFNSNRILVYKNHILIPGNVKSKNMLVYKSLESDENLRIRNRISPDYFTYTTNSSTIYPFRDSFVFKIGEADTIYSFTPKSGSIEPKSVIFTKKHRFDETKIKDARSTKGPGRFANIQAATENCFSIALLGETDKYYLCSVNVAGTKPSTRLLFVHKLTGESFYGQIFNDFAGGLALKNIPYFYNNNTIVFQYSAIGILNDIKLGLKEVSENKTLSTIQDLKKGLSTDDNDILLICKLRL